MNDQSSPESPQERTQENHTKGNKPTMNQETIKTGVAILAMVASMGSAISSYICSNTSKDSLYNSKITLDAAAESSRKEMAINLVLKAGELTANGRACAALLNMLDTGDISRIFNHEGIDVVKHEKQQIYNNLYRCITEASLTKYYDKKI